MRILVVGHERSGTTWVGQVLGSTPSSSYLHEPDNVGACPFAIRAMAGRGTLPVLAAGDPGSRSLVRLWDVAFRASPPRFVRGQGNVSMRLLRGASEAQLDRVESSDRQFTVRLRLAAALGVPPHIKGGSAFEHHVVKSVHAPFMVDWLSARWDPAVVVCFRHPLDVVASAIEAGTGARTFEVLRLLSPEALATGTERYGVPLPPADDHVARAAWRAGLVMSALADACRAHPEFHVVHHEQLCENPVDRLRELVDAVGLAWTTETEHFVIDSNQPGTIWETRRIANEQQDRWRTRLTLDEARAAAQVLRQFPIAARYADDLAV